MTAMQWGDPQQTAPGFLIHLFGTPPKPKRPVKYPKASSEKIKLAPLNTGPGPTYTGSTGRKMSYFGSNLSQQKCKKKNRNLDK